MVLIISANPLFKEVIHQAVMPLGSDCVELEPDAALASIPEIQPETIIIDETITPTLFEAIIHEARALSKTRIVVLNPQQNEIVLLDSRRATIGKISDLVEAIASKPSVSIVESNQLIFIEEAEEAQALAGIYGFLASVYNQHPNLGLLRRMRAIGVRAFLDLIADEVQTNDVGQGIQLITHFLERSSSLEEEQVEIVLAEDWTRICCGIHPTFGPPPYEALYRQDGIDPGVLLQTLAAGYAEAGAMIKSDYSNRLDYIGLELNFLSFLAEQEASAWKNGEEAVGNQFRHRAGLFIAEHLVLWADHFFSKALEHASTDFFKGILLVSRGVIAMEPETAAHGS